MKIEILLQENHLYLSYEIKLKLKSKAESCNTYIEQLKSTLKSLRSKIPSTITQIESIQEDIDFHHDNVNKATVAGATAGIVGGGMMIAGLIAAPFTFGVSLGLTATGAVVGAAGGMTSAGAKVVDHMQSSSNNETVRKLLKTVESLCKRAQEQHSKIEQCCSEIGSILAENNVSLHATTTQEKIKVGWNVVSFLRAPPGATAAIVFSAVGGTARFGEITATTAIRALAVTMKTVGVIFVGLGIIVDVYCLGKSIKELVMDEKCSVSKAISDQIYQLKELESNITETLNAL